jgi:hypothetical protein
MSRSCSVLSWQGVGSPILRVAFLSKNVTRPTPYESKRPNLSRPDLSRPSRPANLSRPIQSRPIVPCPDPYRVASEP